MNKQLRDKWVAALRSGEYQQTTGELCSGDRYCCLGVLLAVSDIDDEMMEGHNTLDSRSQFRELRDECRLGSTSPVHGQTLQSKLIDLNDDERLPFPDIADWIEQNVPIDSDAAALEKGGVVL